MESRDRITVYIDTDGLVTVDIPKGVMPDRKAIRSVMAAINSERRQHHEPHQAGDYRDDRGHRGHWLGDSVTIP